MVGQRRSKRYFLYLLRMVGLTTILMKSLKTGGEMAEFVKNIDTLRKQVHGSNIIIQLVNKQYNEGCQQFMGKMEHPKFITPQQNEAER